MQSELAQPFLKGGDLLHTDAVKFLGIAPIISVCIVLVRLMEISFSKTNIIITTTIIII